jgi:hypothetical protein
MPITPVVAKEKIQRDAASKLKVSKDTEMASLSSIIDH